MEYKDYETVTLSLERYEEMKNEIQELAEELKSIKKAFSVEEKEDGTRKVVVHKEILDQYIKLTYYRRRLFYRPTIPVTEIEYR